MKKIAILLLCVSIAIAAYFLFFQKSSKIVSPISAIAHKVFPTPTMVVQQKASSSLFVPYWSFGQANINTENFDTLLYFGISANTEGIDTDDVGYKKLEQFINVSPTRAQKLLVVRMVNTEVNSKVLDDTASQQKIIKQAIAIAKLHSFSGIVLDFEIKALAFDSVIRNISGFYKNFAAGAHDNNLQFDATLYGDTFYLGRPYDVKTIGAVSDHIYIMTYDFHKAGGDPGPNFPLLGKDTYGYDLPTMISDFGKHMSLNKVIVTLGMFGYNWTVDDKGQSDQSAQPLSFTDIHAKYLANCSEKNCHISRDGISSETNITYVDDTGEKHIIWFEDPTSLEKKKEYLKSMGLNASAVWAYSYF